MEFLNLNFRPRVCLKRGSKTVLWSPRFCNFSGVPLSECRLKTPPGHRRKHQASPLHSEPVKKPRHLKTSDNSQAAKLVSSIDTESSDDEQDSATGTYLRELEAKQEENHLAIDSEDDSSTSTLPGMRRILSTPTSSGFWAAYRPAAEVKTSVSVHSDEASTYSHATSPGKIVGDTSSDGGTTVIKRDTCGTPRRTLQLEQEALWKERGYPTINWDKISSRVRESKTLLEACLAAKTFPVFRERYIAKLSQSHPRGGLLDTLLTTNAGGYYGPRGEELV